MPLADVLRALSRRTVSTSVLPTEAYVVSCGSTRQGFLVGEVWRVRLCSFLAAFRYGSVYLGLVCGAFCLFPSAFLLIGAGTDLVKQRVSLLVT